jgi:DNA-binding HxlR family transcriptional regulator
LKSGITKTEIQTLINVEDGADVTDTDNVTTAGALMDSEVTDLAGVKTVTISTLQVKPSEGAFADGDKTKLDGIAAGAQVNVSGDSGNAAVYDNSGTPTLKSGITKTEIQTLINVEDGADVTDTDNVTTAGALMDSEVTDLAGVKTVTISTLQVKPSEGAFADGDKTKLDGIAAGAQVNVSGDSGNAAVYDNSGTPTLKSGITKTEIQTLINVEDGADVTDTDNVTTAGALMDSEVTDLAGVKTVTISTLQVKPSEGAFADGDKTKLDGIAAGAQVNVSGDSGNAAVYDNSGTPTLKSGITKTEIQTLINVEDGADVTDTDNVTTAGALMDSEVTDLAGVKTVTISTLQVKPSEGAFADGDKTKLDGIAAGAQVNVSGDSGNAAVYDNSGTPTLKSGITKTEIQTLINVEDGADVTDTDNVTTAGALMDSEVTDLAGVKTVTISTLQVKPSEGAFADGDKTKLDGIAAGAQVNVSGDSGNAAVYDNSGTPTLKSGITKTEIQTLINVEDGADVTDTDNVTTAGALMDSEVTDLAGVKTVTISTLQVKPSEGAFADGDKTKLDGIAAGAQVNVSGDSGNAAVYDNSGTPTLKSGITKTEIQTLINVEDGADVTDTDNVTTAGALMDSEVTDLAGVKTVTISTLQVKPSEGAFADGDKTKLDGIAAGAQVNVSGDSGNAAVYDNSGTPTLKSGITKTEIQTLINVEDGADVTDTDNVTTAGALMDSEVTDLAGVKTVTISTLQVKPSEGAFADGDKTKLDGIAAGAQVNVSGDSGNAAVYDNSGTPTLKSGITKTEIQTLINVEDGADVTDTDNVTTAGALMDSEVTDLAGVKTVTISTLQVKPSEGAFADGDKTKLDGIAAGAQVNVSGDSGNAAVYDNSGTPTLKSGITKTEIQTLINVEDGADVTDTDNVTTAGALMDSEVTDLAGVKTVTISTLQVKPSEGAFADGDKTKLDGIAAGAQVNVSGDSGNAAVYDNSGTPTLKSGITKTEIQTLINVEDGADVTDTDNVTTAGALMDSEVTDLAGVKTVTISTLQVKPSEGAFADGDKTKLDGIAAGAQVNVSGDSGNAAVYDNSGTPTLKSGITKTEIQTLINVEDGADVTDTDNVTTAGALMDSEVTDLAGVKTVTISTLQVKPSEGAFADGDKTKLDGIAAGAQVNVSGDSGNAAVYDNSGTPTLKSGITKTEIQTLINVEDGAKDDQTAAEVVSTATTNIAALTVQTALAELDAEKLALAGGTMSGDITMGANDISGTGSVTATTFSGNLIGNILDSNENELVKGTATASAVNEINVTNAATGNGATISASGDDTDIDLNIEAKGTGVVNTSGDLTVGGAMDVTGSTSMAAINSDGVVTLSNNTTSSSSSTGALKVTGGVGVAENLNVGGTIDVTGSTSMAAISSDGVVTLSNNTTSTSSTTGALKVTGGVGVAENLNVGGALDVTGDTNLNSTTTSTSSSTGALVVDGGVGVAENLNVGGAIDVTDAATTRNNLGIYGGSHPKTHSFFNQKKVLLFFLYLYKKKLRMSFLLSANLFEDQWSFIILRDMLLLKRATIKEFKSSREKIDDHTLSKTLRKLCINGYIEILHDGSSESNCKRYIVSSKGLSLLPILMELYLFSCDRFEESLLSPFELNFKKEATQNCTLLKKKIIREYHNFSQKLKIEVAFS